MQHICRNGFEHHVAMNMSQVAAGVNEALSRYVGWDAFEEGEDFITGKQPRYRSANEIHLGGELYIPYTPVRLRAGYYLDPIAYRGVNIVTDRRFLTAGIGVLLKPAMAIDIAVVRGNFELSQPNYTASSTTTRMFSSVSYRF